MLKVLVACEFSGTVREAFRRRGHDAWSCDLLPTEDGSPYHIQGDVREVLNADWDLMIAHPPCTYLCNSGVVWLHEREGRWEKLAEAIEFFETLQNAPIPHICIENPIPHKYARERIGLYTQIIQPWQFGHPESKATCLWLKGLPLLRPTKIVDISSLPKKVRQRLHYIPPSKDRWKKRSVTYKGIAEAMAEQWGSFLCKNRTKTRGNC